MSRESRPFAADLRPRLPRRSPARTAVVRQVPAARRAPGPAPDRAGVDRPRAPRCRVVHEALRPGMAGRSAHPGSPRRAARDGRDGSHGRGCGGRVAAVGRARPRLQAVDARRLPLDFAPDRSRLGRAPARGRHAAAARALEDDDPGSNRNVQKRLVVLHGIFRRAMRVWGLPRNPVADVERPRVRVSSDVDAFSPEEIHALVRAAGSEQDGALFLTAALTGLRMGELLALAWGDLDFAGQAVRVRRSYTAHGGLSSPKSGRVRSVPMVPDVARALAALATREWFTADDDLVFPGQTGGHQDGAALRIRYKAAAQACGSAAVALPRSAPHLRDARRSASRGAGGSGVDGPLEHPDDDALHPSPRPRR